MVQAQVMAGLVCLGFYMTSMTSISAWKEIGWEPWRIGVATTTVNLAYAFMVALGGRLADRWGRARTGLAGAAAGIGGCVTALFLPQPWSALTAFFCVNAAGAFCFPALAGLVSDSGAGERGPAMPLHRKVSGYNIGWSGGELVGFAVFGLLAAMPRRTGFASASVVFVILAAWFASRRGMKAKVHKEAGDRTSRPGLPLLTFMGRFNLLLACVLGSGMVSQLEKSFGTAVGLEEARRLTSVLMTCYAAGLVCSFVALGRWDGWVFRPRRLALLQLGLPLGGAGLVLLGRAGLANPEALAACGLAMGASFGAVYTGSLYYSLRLPSRAGASAGVHETFIGTGNVIGPFLAGVFLQFREMPDGWGLGGLGEFICAVSLAGVLFQSILIPRVERRF